MLVKIFGRLPQGELHKGPWNISSNFLKEEQKDHFTTHPGIATSDHYFHLLTLNRVLFRFIDDMESEKLSGGKGLLKKISLWPQRGECSRCHIEERGKAVMKRRLRDASSFRIWTKIMRSNLQTHWQDSQSLPVTVVPALGHRDLQGELVLTRRFAEVQGDLARLLRGQGGGRALPQRPVRHGGGHTWTC